MSPLALVLLSEAVWEKIGVLAAAVTAAGVWRGWRPHRQLAHLAVDLKKHNITPEQARWRSHWHLADVEEDLKNDKLTPEQAQRRSRWIEIRASGLIFGGLGLMLMALVALLV